MRLSKINSMPPANIRFYWQDEPVNLSYYPHRINKAWVASMQERPIKAMLADVLAGWDVEQDDGSLFQPDPALPRADYIAAWVDLLSEIENTAFGLAVLNAILDDFSPAPPAAMP
jgi:hypothetical protein